MKSIVLILSYLLPLAALFSTIYYINTKEKSKKKVSVILLCCCILAYFILYFSIIYSFFFVKYDKIAFDSSNWKSDPNERWLMIDDLLKSKILIEKDTFDLKLILGPPNIKIDSTQSWIYSSLQGGYSLGFIFHEVNIDLKEGIVYKTGYNIWED